MSICKIIVYFTTLKVKYSFNSLYIWLIIITMSIVLFVYSSQINMKIRKHFLKILWNFRSVHFRISRKSWRNISFVLQYIDICSMFKSPPPGAPNRGVGAIYPPNFWGGITYQLSPPFFKNIFSISWKISSDRTFRSDNNNILFR